MTAADFLAERQFALTPFGRVAYVERGTGDAALFLHGFPLNGLQWRGAIPPLSKKRRCIAPDFLGLGYSEVGPAQDVGPEAQLGMVLAFMDKRSLSKVDVVANDSGGAVAQLLAARHPHRVRTLLLTNCDSEIESPPAALLPVIEMSRAGSFVDKWLAPWVADKALARSAGGLGGQCYVDPGHPTDEAIEYYLRPLVSTSARHAQVHRYALSLERNPLTGIGPSLRACGAPTRIVWGTADTIFSAAGAEHLNRAFPGSRGVRHLPSRKLFWPEELPEIVVQEALDLWGLV